MSQAPVIRKYIHLAKEMHFSHVQLPNSSSTFGYWSNSIEFFGARFTLLRSLRRPDFSKGCTHEQSAAVVHLHCKSVCPREDAGDTEEVMGRDGKADDGKEKRRRPKRRKGGGHEIFGVIQRGQC